MQFAAKYDLKAFAQALLENNTNPNYAESYARNPNKRKNIGHGFSEILTSPDKTRCMKYPILLAAEYGNHEILRLFIRHDVSRSKVNHSNDNTDDQEGIPLRKQSKLDMAVDFKASNQDKSMVTGNVLHVHSAARLTELIAKSWKTLVFVGPVGAVGAV